MTVDGWNDPQGGTHRFICNDPGSDDFAGRVFAGLAPWPGGIAGAPLCDVGVDDFSVEMWVRKRFTDSPASDILYYSGLLKDDTGLSWGLGIQWNPDTYAFSTSFFDGVTLIGAGSVTPTRLGVWNYCVWNCDRSGNMTIYIDNELKNTTAISTASGDINDCALFGLVGNSTDIVDYNAAFGNPEEWDSYAIFPVVVGGIACHSRLLTAAEREDSYRSRGLQNVAQTLCYLDWETEGETGWETDSANIADALRSAAPLPLGAPKGTNGTVKALDKSGNSNHWTIPTQAAYGNVETDFSDRAGTAFGIDSGFLETKSGTRVA